MLPHAGEMVLAVLCALVVAPALQGVNADLAGTFGVGPSGEEDENAHPAVLVGASAGWPAHGRLRIQGDYLFSNISKRIYNRHFLTSSLVVQGKGNTRGFFQAGIGVTRKHWTVPGIAGGRTSGVFLLGGGVTAQTGTGSPWFVRFEGRAYVAAGQNITLVPLLTVGRTF